MADSEVAEIWWGLDVVRGVYRSLEHVTAWRDCLRVICFLDLQHFTLLTLRVHGCLLRWLLLKLWTKLTGLLRASLVACVSQLAARGAEPRNKFLENLALFVAGLEVSLTVPPLIVIEVWLVLFEGCPLNDVVLPELVAKGRLVVLVDEASVREVYVSISARAVSLALDHHSMSTKSLLGRVLLLTVVKR